MLRVNALDNIQRCQMTRKPFKPKGEDELRKGFEEILGDETDEKVLDSLVAQGLKDEKFKASLHKQKSEQGSGRKHYKQMLEKAGIDPKTGEPVKKDPEKGGKSVDSKTAIAEEVFLQGGGRRTNLRQIRKVMSATGKSFAEAQKDSLYTAFVEKQDAETKSRGGQLGASGGSGVSTNKETEMERTMGGKLKSLLPPGFTPDE